MDIVSLPYFTPLVKDYLTRFDSSPIHQFFSCGPSPSGEEWQRLMQERAKTEASRPADHRDKVVRSIRELHSGYGLMNAAAEENLKRLASKDAFAIVTGQQVGILGGPLYTFYKTFTAIQRAKELSEQFPEKAFVPVFWLETEDHDLAETSAIHVLDKASELRTVRYTPAGYDPSSPDQNWRKQIGPMPLEEEPLRALFSELRDTLPQTEFTEETIASLERCYASGKTWGRAFAELLHSYFGNEGLLLFDANSRAMKSLTRDLLWKEIETSPQLSEKIVLDSVRLEERYHAQVKPKALNLFYLDDDGERLPLIERERAANQTTRSFFLKGTRKSFTLEELKKIVDATPERFSPNVVLRPLVQDTLLPTIAYVAGPGEIAYFAQFGSAFAWAGLPMPVIAPRLTATLVEDRFERLLTKFSITAEEVIREGADRVQSILSSLIDPALLAQFESTLAAAEADLESLRAPATNADPTLDGALTSLKGKVLTAIRDFQNKALAAERKRHATTKTQFDKLLASMLPAGGLQERELSIVHFLNKYGPAFSEQLKEALRNAESGQGEHHVIHLHTMKESSGADSGTDKSGASNAESRTSDATRRLMAVPDEQSA